MRINIYSWKILTIVVFPLCVFTGWLISKFENMPQPDPPHLPAINTSIKSEMPKTTPKPSPNTEKQTAYVIGDHRLIISESPQRYAVWQTDASNSAQPVSPYPVITDIGPDNTIRSYSVLSITQVKGIIESDDLVPMVESVKKLQVDEDPEKELIVEWLLTAGGSDGTRFISVFDLQKGMIVPLSLLPSENTSSYLQIKNITTGQEHKIEATLASFQTEYTDLNKDGKNELLFYWYDWMQDESHYGTHFWNLHVYELINGNSQEASWWNGGKRYETEEKLGFEKKDRDTIMRYYKELVNK